MNLNAIAAGVEKMLRRILGEDIEFAQRLAPDVAVVEADPGQMEQVILNLVINARDAMPTGGKLVVETSNVEFDESLAKDGLELDPGRYVQLTVSDTGCGMDVEVRDRIFEPFFTTKEIGKGTGLGLSTVLGIVKQSGGGIRVDSELGKGTTFRIFLPVLRTDHLLTTTNDPSPPRRRQVAETILLVEDEEALRHATQRMLENAGYTVLTAGDGLAALAVSDQHQGKIQLLLTDVVMPRMGGRMLVERLVQSRPAVQVLYMSGYMDKTIGHHGVLDAETHLLEKPFTSAQLMQKIEALLG